MTQHYPALHAKAVEKWVELNHERLEILKGIDLEVAQGESLAILGRSGSGKTTLLGILAGLDTPSSGSVHLMNERLDNIDEEGRAALRARYVGFVFQSFHLLPALTALENVMLPLELKGKAAEKAARDFLAKVGLRDRMQHFPAQLSGGEQQRVALARAFACEPRLLFADEPTGNLDEETGRYIADLMFDLNDQLQTTLIMVTHDAKLAQRCDRSLHIEAGQIISEPEMEALS